MRRYLRFGFVAQYFLYFRKYLGCQLWNDLERLEVVDDLFWLRCAEDDRARVRLDCNPCECKVGYLTTEF